MAQNWRFTRASGREAGPRGPGLPVLEDPPVTLRLGAALGLTPTLGAFHALVLHPLAPQAHRTLRDLYAGWNPAFEALKTSFPRFLGLSLNVTPPVTFVRLETRSRPAPVTRTSAPASGRPRPSRTRADTVPVRFRLGKPVTVRRRRGWSLICWICVQSPWLRSSSAAATRQ